MQIGPRRSGGLVTFMVSMFSSFNNCFTKDLPYEARKVYPEIPTESEHQP
jgi:hypothetical protein